MKIKDETLSNLNYQKLKQASFNFESFFIQKMFKIMANTTSMSKKFGKDQGGQFFMDMYLKNIADNYTSKNALGLKEKIYNQLTSQNYHQDKKDINSLNRTNTIKHKLNKLNKFNDLRYETKQEIREFINTSNKHYSHNEILEMIEIKANHYQLDSALVKSIVKQESNFNIHAISRQNAKGLMQLMDDTAKDMKIKNVFDPFQNLDGGCKYLKMLCKKYKNNLPKVLAAYNAGPGNVAKYKGVPPFSETKNYIKKVLQNYKQYLKEDSKSSN